MAKADRNFKIPKWFAGLLWLIGIVAVYVGTSWWWHTGGSYQLEGKLGIEPDPFSDPGKLKDISFNNIPESAIILGNRVLYDFPTLYRELTNPLRNRTDPIGNPYFDHAHYPWRSAAAHLRAMKEPSLLKRNVSDESEYFRLTQIPTFSAAHSFRISIKADSTIELQAIQLDGQGGYYPGNIRNQKTTSLTRADYEYLIGENETPEFWTPISDKEDGYFSGMDGSVWVFESSTPTSYKAIQIANPYVEENTPGFLKDLIKKGEIREPYPYAEIGTRLLKEYGFPDFSREEP